MSAVPQAGALWINSELPESRTNQLKYKFIGWLLAQSLCNRAGIDARFPEVCSTLLEP